jgi:PAS domain S-box-containing protein
MVNLSDAMTEPTKDELLAENHRLRDEVSDLKMLLEATAGHSDILEADLLQRVDDTIKESEKKFRSITETLPVAVLITNKSGDEIFYANEAAGSLFGLSIEELKTRKTTEFYNSSDHATIVELVDGNGYLKNKELKGFNAQGNSWWVELSVKPIEFDGTTALLSIYHDVTNRRMLEMQLRQTQKMEAIGTLAGGIAHDFNNILLAIFGYSELALTQLEKGSPLRRHLQNILIASERAKNLVYQILAFSRQGEQELRPIQVKTTVREALKLLRASLPSTIDINNKIQSNSVVMGDPTQIHQVLMNLCTNAGYAMQKSGGELSIELSEVTLDAEFAAIHQDVAPGLYVKLTVSDTGEGIPSEILPRIFEPFFTTKDKSKGSGWGLSVVHGIVKKHGGTVIVESELGKGSTFIVYLPVTEKQLPMPPVVSQTNHIGNEHILFVDDDQTIVTIGEEMLTAKGYRVTPAMGSQEALAIFQSNPAQFDMVITDMTMPHMTGDHLALEIMSLRPDIPVIICSGGDAIIHEKELLAAGIKAIVMKPFSLDSISRSIRKVLDQHSEQM